MTLPLATPTTAVCYPAAITRGNHPVHAVPLPLPVRRATVETRLDALDERLATIDERLSLVLLRLETLLEESVSLRQRLDADVNGEVIHNLPILVADEGGLHTFLPLSDEPARNPFASRVSDRVVVVGRRREEPAPAPSPADAILARLDEMQRAQESSALRCGSAWRPWRSRWPRPSTTGPSPWASTWSGCTATSAKSSATDPDSPG